MALGKLDIIIAADTAQIKKDMSTAVGIMQSSTKAMESVAKTAASAIGGYFAFDIFQSKIQQTLDFADSLSKLSQKTGITADGLYSLSAAAKLSDVSFEDMSKSLGKFSKSIGENSKTFDTLGLSIKNNDGTLKNSFDLLSELSDKFADMPDGASKATLAMQLFGKSGTDIIPLLNSGSEALKEYLGVMSSDTTKSAERFNDSITKIGLSLKSSLYSTIGDYLPALNSLSKTFEDASKNTQNLSIRTEVLRGIYDVSSASFYAVRDAVKSANEVYETSSNLLHSMADSIVSLGQSGEESAPKLNFFQFLATDIQAVSLGVKVVSNTVKAAINDFMNLGFEVDILIAKSKNLVGAGSKENDVKIAQLQSWIAQRNMQNADMAFQEADLAKEIENYKKRSNYDNNLKHTNRYLDKAKANLYDLKLLSGEINLTPKYDYGLADDTKVKAYETALMKINDAINKNSFTAYEYGLTLIDKEVAEYQKAGIQKSKIDEYVFNAKMELGIKQLEQETKDREAREKEVKAQYDKEQDAMLGYYKAVGMESDAFYLEEVMKLQKLADAGILSNSQMLEVWTKDNEKFQDEQFKKSHEWLYDFFDNMDKALDNKLLDGFKTRFKNFGSWLKDLFSSIGDSIFASLSRTLAGSITSSLQGGIVNTFKSYGGFGSASLVGTSLSASDISSIAGLSGSTVTDGMIKTSGGTLIDQASGTVTSQGSDAMSILSMASGAKTIYGALTDGISGSILSGFNGIGNFLGNAGFGSLGSGISQFGAGFSSPLSFAAESPLAGLYGSGIGSTSTATMAGGMLSSGLIGYGIGSLGDAIFGAQTKAGIGGAAGAAIGSIIPGIGTIIGGIIGSVIGGFFGSTKQTGAGIDILGNASADSANGQYWQSYKKKSWFSSSSWTNTTGFGEAENQAIMQTIGIYDTLLSQLGTYNDLIVAGGRFSNLQEFLDGNVVKSFLTAINPQNLDEIYKSWTDYAAKIDTTITQALATAVSGYTTYGRGFTEWKLGSGTTEQLKFTAEYLQKDFTALASSLGANGVTVDNFLAKYDEAIKANFTQDTITAWASLGDTLMKSTDATVKYKEALDQLNGTTTYSLPVDTMLAKVNNSSSTIDIKQLVTTQTNQNDSVIGLLVQSVKALQEILRVSQFGKTIV